MYAAKAADVKTRAYSGQIVSLNYVMGVRKLFVVIAYNNEEI